VLAEQRTKLIQRDNKRNEADQPEPPPKEQAGEPEAAGVFGVDERERHQLPSYNRAVQNGIVIETERLRLRLWLESDRAPFARMNADRRVMEFMPACLSRKESNALADRIESHFDRHGFGLYAAELRSDGQFTGFIGISVPNFQAHFTPSVEIGWRLDSAYWGQGLATEGARAVVSHAFASLKTPELVSFTVPANLRSRRVMEKIGMTHNASDDFDHPNLPENHPLRRHVLYRLRRPE
jgi:RimJ/RimL family protein N-acetyltransferase